MAVAIRRASADDADFIAWTILTAQRGQRQRGYFDFALNLPEPECLAFVRKVAVAAVPSQWHVSCFWIAEQDGVAAAALCALPVGEARTTVRPAIEASGERQWLESELTLPHLWHRSRLCKVMLALGKRQQLDDRTRRDAVVASRAGHDAGFARPCAEGGTRAGFYARVDWILYRKRCG